MVALVMDIVLCYCKLFSLDTIFTVGDYNFNCFIIWAKKIIVNYPRLCYFYFLVKYVLLYVTLKVTIMVFCIPFMQNALFWCYSNSKIITEAFLSNSCWLLNWPVLLFTFINVLRPVSNIELLPFKAGTTLAELGCICWI